MLLMLFGTYLQVYAYSFSAVNSDGKTIYYNITATNSTVEVTYKNTNYNSYSGIINIPSTVVYNGNTYNVTSIGNYAFYQCTGLYSVVIPNSITSIGYYAFYSCSNLMNITIPNSITSIGDHAFYYCTSLMNITLSNSLTGISSYTFYNCTNLTNITIPNSVTSIGEYAFSGCSHLTNITIPNSVASVLGYAFQNCTNLSTVTIGKKVTSIYSTAFSGCNNINTINYNAKNCSSSDVFLNKTNITTLNIGDSVQLIPNGFVAGCTGLTNITIPNSVSVIGQNAFKNCSNVDKLTIGANVEIIGASAFYNCTNLDTIISAVENAPLLSNNTFMNVDSTIAVIVPCTNIDSYLNNANWNYFTNINNVSYTTDATICQGEIYTFNGNTYSETGTYTEQVIGANGCEITATLNLEVMPPSATTINAEISINSPYYFNGNAYSTAGVFYDTLVNTYGCDSIITLSINSLPPIYDTITNIINDTNVITLYDTIINTINDTNVITLYDTIINTINDTNIITLYDTIINTINDTNLITLYDTITNIINDTNIVMLYDTIINTINDTNIITLYDTILVEVLNDTTIVKDFYITMSEGNNFEFNGNTYNQLGTYYVEEYISDWLREIIVLHISFNSSVDDVLQVVGVSLYPNPAEREVCLDIDGLQEDAEVFIFDIQGKEIKRYNYNKGERNLLMDVADLETGTYNIRIVGKTTNISKKLIVR